MPDIAKCTNNNCSKKETCYRWTSKPSKFNQVYMRMEHDKGDCRYYWEDKQIKKTNDKRM